MASDQFPDAKYVEEIGTKPFQTKPVLIKGHRPDEPVEEEEYIFRFGGMDLAKRNDHSAFECLRLYREAKTGDFYLQEEAFMEWPHVNYKRVADDMLRIHGRFPMEQLGFDRSGVGDAASELFDKSTLPMVEIVSTMERKKDIVKIVKGLMEQTTTNGRPKLVIDKFTDLKQQLMEQETIISKAGNELYEHPPNRHDDRFWALGYACYVAIPYVIGYPEPIIRRVGVDPEVRDIDAEIDALMGFDSQVMTL